MSDAHNTESCFHSPDPDRNAFMHAVVYGDLDEVRRLLPLVGDDMRSGRAQFKPLHVAAGKNGAELLKLLIPASDMEQRDEAGRNALFPAVVDAECLALLLPLCDTTATTTDGRSPMFEAVNTDNVAGVRMLIPHTDLKATDRFGFTPLMFAVCKGPNDPRKRTEIAQLIAPLSDANHQDRNGMTALMHACVDVNLPLVEVLAPLTDMRLRQRKGRTAFDIAVGNRDWDCADIMAPFVAIHDEPAVNAAFARSKKSKTGGKNAMPRWAACVEARALQDVVASVSAGAAARENAELAAQTPAEPASAAISRQGGRRI